MMAIGFIVDVLLSFTDNLSRVFLSGNKELKSAPIVIFDLIFLRAVTTSFSIKKASVRKKV